MTAPTLRPSCDLTNCHVTVRAAPSCSDEAEQGSHRESVGRSDRKYPPWGGIGEAPVHLQSPSRGRVTITPFYDVNYERNSQEIYRPSLIRFPLNSLETLEERSEGPNGLR